MNNEVEIYDNYVYTAGKFHGTDFSYKKGFIGDKSIYDIRFGGKAISVHEVTKQYLFIKYLDQGVLDA